MFSVDVSYLLVSIASDVDALTTTPSTPNLFGAVRHLTAHGRLVYLSLTSARPPQTHPHFFLLPLASLLAVHLTGSFDDMLRFDFPFGYLIPCVYPLRSTYMSCITHLFLLPLSTAYDVTHHRLLPLFSTAA